MNHVASHEPAVCLEKIVSRAQALYSRPTVAMEIVRLADQPRLNPGALKKCVEQDPALACKILRVVNSSLYGLNRPVADLNQAIAILGIKPLKLLVLGFNLPDALFAEVASRQLQWYWTNTLTRAVAARLISEQMWNQAGDEAFIAGLLQDIGILVLIRELGASYTRFLGGAIQEKCHLAALEQDTLGFDHTQLSAALLAHWQLPPRLVAAIATPKRQARLSGMTRAEADLPQILHLAEMLAQLVGQKRLGVLPDLLEAGKVYRGMTKQKLAALVESLQPQVDQLAEVLSLELAGERDYVEMLLEAHRQMAALSEEIDGRGRCDTSDDRAATRLLEQTRELTEAMHHFLDGPSPNAPSDLSDRRWGAGHAAHRIAGNTSDSDSSNPVPSKAASTLPAELRAAANRCRERRSELSLLLVQPHAHNFTGDPSTDAIVNSQVRLALLGASASLDRQSVLLLELGQERTAAILSNCERRVAVAIAQNAIALLAGSGAGNAPRFCETITSVSVGVATAGVVPRNFEPARLLESAERCLSAARACGISSVKSIEV